MAKAALKTRKNESSVHDFLNTVKDEQQRKDSIAILQMMKKATGDEPKMWGAAIIGFGNVHLKYESGRELDWFKIGFSPRKQNITLYGVNLNAQAELLKNLGKYKTGKGCLYINKLTEVDTAILKKIIEKGS
ncbi:MAG: DUF1801 domain-containing protein [Chitinophagales bacterium]